MKITCYGSRGSIPASGPNYAKYGGDTTCLFIESKSGDKLIIDAGSGIRDCGNHILQNKINKVHLLFTHAHWDHLLGFPFFKPIYISHFALEIYGYSFGLRGGIKKVVEGVFRHPYFPITSHAMRAKVTYHNVTTEPFAIGSLRLTAIPLSHPDGGYGYKIEEDGKIFTFLTDNELGSIHKGGLTMAEYAQLVSHSDLLVHDAEFKAEEYPTRQNWGHSCFLDAVSLAKKAKVKKLGLFHHNQDRPDAQIDAMVEEAQHLLKRSKVECMAVAQGQVFEL